MSTSNTVRYFVTMFDPNGHLYTRPIVGGLREARLYKLTMSPVHKPVITMAVTEVDERYNDKAFRAFETDPPEHTLPPTEPDLGDGHDE